MGHSWQHASSTHHNLALFAPRSSRGFGEAIAYNLGGALDELEEREFEDGEHKIRPLQSVRGKDVYVIQSLYGEPGQSANDKLCRLLFLIGALKDAAAARVTAVVPYLAYARKDQKSKSRDPVTTRYVAAMFEAVGTDVMVTIDVHNLAAYQNAFRCRTEHLEAASLFVPHLVSIAGGNTIVVSPDAGGMKRAERLRARLARALQVPVGLAFTEKHRSAGVLSGELLVGDVRQRNAIIVDDLISSGSTLARAARSCREHGAASVTAVATHGLFCAGAEAALAESAINRVFITDTVPPFRLEGLSIAAKVTVLPCAALVAEAIRRLHTYGSLVELSEIGLDQAGTPA